MRLSHEIEFLDMTWSVNSNISIMWKLSNPALFRLSSGAAPALPYRYTSTRVFPLRLVARPNRACAPEEFHSVQISLFLLHPFTIHSRHWMLKLRWISYDCLILDFMCSVIVQFSLKKNQMWGLLLCRYCSDCNIAPDMK